METIRRIQEHIKIAQSRQKSYVDKRMRPLEFQIGNKVFLKGSPTKGIKRFGVRFKLSPRYIGPYEIIEKLNLVAYCLDLMVKLEHVHNVFHIFQLRKCTPSLNHAIVSEPIEITVELVYEEQPIQILDRRIKQLQQADTSSQTALVKSYLPRSYLGD